MTPQSPKTSQTPPDRETRPSERMGKKRDLGYDPPEDRPANAGSLGRDPAAGESTETESLGYDPADPEEGA